MERIYSKADIKISFSGGKDSCLILDIYCQIVTELLPKYKDKPIEAHEKYGDAPMYTTLNEYIDNELIVLQMQIENLRLKLQDILNN